MTTAAIELPAGEELRRQIEEIEMHAIDKRVRQTIAARVVIANDPATAFVPHEEVFAESRARLMARLAGGSPP
ncbi:MAG: hypothetical protein V4578_08075 [Pseudomonadota bacterium]